MALIVAGLLAVAIAVVAALAWRRRGRSAAEEQAPAAAQPEAVTGSAATAPAEAPASDADMLAAGLASASKRLWAAALSSTRFDFDVPAGHEPVMLAARKALAADPLSDRYFPRRPMLMPQLLAAVNDPDAPPLKLAGIISQDPVLTGNILRLANSVYFRLSSVPVESIQRAVVVCGTDGLQSLAATALVQPVFRAGSAAAQPLSGGAVGALHAGVDRRGNVRAAMVPGRPAGRAAARAAVGARSAGRLSRSARTSIARNRGSRRRRRSSCR